MKILSAQLCKRGGRDYNQDFVSVVTRDGAACAAVCDGLGSYFGSEVASKTAATEITGFFARKFDAGTRLPDRSEFYEAVYSAHCKIQEAKEKNRHLSSSCTTVAVAATDLETSVFAHIGDTRVYFFRSGEIMYQTTDHSLAQAAVNSGEIEQKEIRSHKDQNKLTRVLGSDYYVSPDIFTLDKPLKPGDRILLCTDGFWEYVYEEEMADCLKQPDPAAALAQMEKLLLSRAFGAFDNYSAAALYVTE